MNWPPPPMAPARFPYMRVRMNGLSNELATPPDGTREGRHYISEDDACEM